LDPNTAIDLTREAIITALLLCAPVLIVGLVVGLLIGLAQALTQIQDQTVAFVPKLLAMVAALTLTLPWLLQMMSEYVEALFRNIPQTISGG
jgi:flagellar biosynthetic protein FliQ